jgi:hypothetical protein
LQEHKLSKGKTEPVGSPSLPNRKSAQKKFNKGEKVEKGRNRKTLLTKVAKKKPNAWKTEQVSQNDTAVK